MPILPIPIPQNVLQMASSFASAPPNSSIYFYKDANGVLRSTNIENMTNDLGVGYPYQFINGDQIYTQLPITNYNDIQFINPGSTTIPTLWNDRLKVWIDGSDRRTISGAKQKIISKSYGAITYLIENTTDYNFQTGTDNIICSGFSNIETTNALDVKPYWALAIVFKLDPTQTADNKLIFQHNRIRIKLTNNLAADTTTQLMIGLYDNSTFICGLELSPNSSPLYYIFCSNTGDLYVNGVRCQQTKPTFNFYQTTSQKIYLSSINGQSNISSNLTLYELMYFTSDLNDNPAKTAIDSYILGKHTNIDIYIPLHNTPLLLHGFEWLTSSTHENWNLYNINKSNIPSEFANITRGITVIDYKSITFGNGDNDFYGGTPIFTGMTVIDVATAKANNYKYYYEFTIIKTSNTSTTYDIAFGFCNLAYGLYMSGDYFRIGPGTDGYIQSYHCLNKGLAGDNAIFSASTSHLGASRNIGIGLNYQGGVGTIEIYNNGTKVHQSTLIASHACMNNGTLFPTIGFYGSTGLYSYTYLANSQATMKPANYIYVE